jgi:peptidyl-prolyl cis-trans isomerase C
VCVFALSVFLGCDNLNFSKAPRAAQREKTTPQKLSVTGPVVAKVNNMPITLEDLNEEINSYNSLLAANNRPEAKITTRDQKVDYLKNEMVRRLILYQEALDRGIDREAEVVKALEKTKMDLLVVELLRQETGKIDVNSKEIEDYYNTYKEQLKEPEERQIREVVVSNEQEAKDIMIQLLQGGDFATLAKERSISASAKNGGDLGFVKKGEKGVQFDEVAFSDTLEAGRISSIFKGPDGYYILKLEGKRGGKQRSLSEMWDDIKKGLTFLKQQKAIDDLIGKLSRVSKIEVYEGEIK